MKIFVLLSRFPYPLEKGDKLRAYHQLRVLSDRHEIHLGCLTDRPIKSEWKKEIEKYCDSLHLFKLSRTQIYWNTAKQFFLNKPYQIGYFYQAGIQRKINTIVKDSKPDHIYCQLIRTAEYVKNMHSIPKTLDYQDALSTGMLRRAEISSGLKKRLFLAEGRRLSEYENRIFDYFNHHTIISKQDQALISHPSNTEIEVIENGISAKYFDYKIAKIPEFDLAFTGNMNYPPNIKCTEFLANEIMPLLPSKTKLVLAGASPHPRIKNLSVEGKIVVTGWIHDIREAYASARIFVAPLFIGTGLQNKLLEAMAMGVPCITTPLANNALGAQAGKHIIVANSAEQFATSIAELLDNEALRTKIAESGKSFVRANYNWEKSVAKLEKLMMT